MSEINYVDEISKLIGRITLDEAMKLEYRLQELKKQGCKPNDKHFKRVYEGLKRKTGL